MVWYKNYIYIYIPKRYIFWTSTVLECQLISPITSSAVAEVSEMQAWIMPHHDPLFFIIIRYHKSTQSILPAIYFPNLQHENPLYILNLFEGNVTLDIQKKCFGYNLSNSRHFHDISQVIVSHTLIHHDPSWVHQKFRTRGSPPDRNMSPGIQRLWPCEKRTSYFTKLFWSPWHVGSAFYLCRANIARSLAPIEFASLCCFFVVEENKNFQWAFFKTQLTHTVQQKPFRDLSSMCFFV